MKCITIVDRLFKLSRLGRLQITILLLNALAPFLAINGRIAFSDPLYLFVGLEFIAFNVIGIIYTLAEENQYAFYSLIFMQSQLVAYAAASSAVGVLSVADGWLRWGIVALCSSAFIIFMVLQRALRKTWGWHAWSLAGANPDHLELYRHYQILSASTTVDAFYAVFFFTVQIFLKNEKVWSIIAFIISCVTTVVLVRPLQLSIRREKIIPVSILLVIYIFGFLVYVYLTVVNVTRLASGQQLNRSDYKGSFGTLGEQYVVVALEASATLIRLLAIVAIANSTTIFGKGLATFFPKRDQNHEGGPEGGYLINPADHVREASDITRSTGGTPHASFANNGSISSTGVSPVHRTGGQLPAGAVTGLEVPFISGSILGSGNAVPNSMGSRSGSVLDRDSMGAIGAANTLNIGVTSQTIFIDATAHSSSVAHRPTQPRETKK